MINSVDYLDPFDMDHRDSFAEIDRDPSWEDDFENDIFTGMSQEAREARFLGERDLLDDMEEDPWTEEDEEMLISTYIEDPDAGKVMCHACPDLVWPGELVTLPGGEKVCSDCATEIVQKEADRKSGRKGNNAGKQRTAAHLKMR